MEKETLAILFSDIRGFTSYTAEKGDEEAYGLARTFLELVEQQVSRHNGYVIKTYGDGAMTSFPEITQALLSAAQTQKALSDYSQEHPRKAISAGIGITWDTVICAKDDLFGHAVNLAKRLADYAKGGQIIVSSNAIEQLGNTEGLRLLHLGNRDLEGLGQERLYELIWREEIARLSDIEDQLTFVLTSDYKLIIGFKKDVYDQLQRTAEELRSAAKGTKGLARLILRDIERETDRYLSEVIGKGICETGVCSERPLNEVDATFDGGKLTLIFDGKRTMGLSTDDFEVTQLHNFFSKLNALKSDAGSRT